MPRNYSHDLRPAKVEAETARLWQRAERTKPCGHRRIVLNCKHCIKSARFEKQVNQQWQRSAS